MAKVHKLEIKIPIVQPTRCTCCCREWDGTAVPYHPR